MNKTKLIDIRDHQDVDENCLTPEEWERLRTLHKIGFKFLSDKQFAEVERLINKYTFKKKRDHEK